MSWKKVARHFVFIAEADTWIEHCGIKFYVRDESVSSGIAKRYYLHNHENMGNVLFPGGYTLT